MRTVANLYSTQRPNKQQIKKKIPNRDYSDRVYFLKNVNLTVLFLFFVNKLTRKMKSICRFATAASQCALYIS